MLSGNAPWIIGTLLAIAFFAYFEARAFRYPQRQFTLSHWIFTIGSTWPLSIFLMGMLCGGLAVHFFWHWCPAGSISGG
jgi:predicted permease